MSSVRPLSIWTAILININIMLGSGIFINTVLLSHNAGPLSPLVYIVVGMLFFPLIYSMAQLIALHKGGTFYDFGKTVHPLAGFLSSWSYFTTKIASATLSIHVFATLVQQIFPSLATLSTLGLDLCILAFFMWLNSFNLKMGSSIQLSFIVLKMIPLLFTLLSGAFLFKLAYFAHATLPWVGVPLSFPFVIFAFSGFEASCSLSQNIENPEKNGPRALFISYAIVLTLVVFYQTMFYGSLGDSLGRLSTFKEAFPSLIGALGVSPYGQALLVTLLHIGIACSALGASYGILYSNAWNLYTLASNNHIPAKSFFIRFNKNKVPFFCVLAEGLLSCIYLVITQAQQVPLQQLSALGSTIAYTVSMVSLFVYLLKKDKKVGVINLLALGSCLVFIGSLLYTYSIKGAYSLVIFSMLLFVGVSSYWFTKK